MDQPGSGCSSSNLAHGSASVWSRKAAALFSYKVEEPNGAIIIFPFCSSSAIRDGRTHFTYRQFSLAVLNCLPLFSSLIDSRIRREASKETKRNTGRRSSHRLMTDASLLSSSHHQPPSSNQESMKIKSLFESKEGMQMVSWLAEQTMPATTGYCWKPFRYFMGDDDGGERGTAYWL